MVIILCDDLIFASKVTATGQALNIPAVMARTPEKVIAKAIEVPVSCIIIDLNHQTLDLQAFLNEVKRLTPVPKLVGFGSHVQADVLREARRLGVDHVMPRSKFHECLETDLPGWVAR